MTQNRAVLDYLRRFGSITPMEAQSSLRCWRLGARIYDLRQAGHEIVNTTPREFGQLARYVLVKEAA